LSGDLVIENLNNLEDLNLRDVRELNKIVIKNCPKLKKINLLDSGIKQLEVGPGLDQLEELSIGFEIDSTDRPTPRKLDKVDFSNITNLKSFKCVGVQETELIGFEKLTQLESFLGAKGVKIPTNKFNSGVPITKDQWDKDYSQRPTKKEFERIQKLHKLIEDAAIKHWSKDQ